MVQADAFLGAIGVDQQTIDEIKKMLDENANELHASPPAAVAAGAFGSSSAGQDLDLQTSTAHQHVVDAIEEMVAGLKGYRVNVVKFGEDMDVTDDDAGVTINNLNNVNLCTTPTDLHTNANPATACVPTVAENGGEG